MSSLYRYRFGVSTFDESKAELTVNGLQVEIQPQSARILSVLLAARNEVVTRADLEAQVWNGRLVGDNVLASAITRLRATLGPANAGLIEAIPRVGYRIAEPVQCTIAGLRLQNELALQVGQEAPQRPRFMLERMLGSEVWLARHRKTGELRVFKYAANASQLADLKREATLAHVLREQLGTRADMLPIDDWNFEQEPFFLEMPYGGDDLLAWSRRDDTLVRLDRSARLALFRQIAVAVASAHSVGILHKDLKPANILVEAIEAGGWRLRLADFGCGRMTDPDRLAELGLSQLGGSGPQTIVDDSLRGTLAYIAPEVLREEPSTERSDIYALGVILYQLLAGDLRSPMVPGWERDIDDALLVEEIARATDGDPLRRTGSVSELIDSLDSLALRREERARQLAERAQHEADRRAAQLARARRPWLIATFATLVLALCSCLFAYYRLHQTEMAEAQQVRNVLALNHFLSRDLIDEANPAWSGRSNVTVQDAARRAAAKIDSTQPAPSPEVAARLHSAMQRTFNSLGLHREVLEESQKTLVALAGLPAVDPAQIDAVRIVYANSLTNLTRIAEAKQQLDLVDKSLRPLSAAPSETLAEYWYVRGGVVQAGSYDWQAAQTMYERADAVMRQLPAIHSHLLEHNEFARERTIMNLRRYPEAERVARALLERNTAKYGKTHYLSCLAQRALADTLAIAYRDERGIQMSQQAFECMKEASGPDTTETARAYARVGNAYAFSKQWEKAAGIHLQAVEMADRHTGPKSNLAIVARNGAAWDLIQQGRFEQARTLLQTNLGHARASYGDDSPVIQAIRFNLADCLLNMSETQGVSALLHGLNADDLAKIRPEYEWAGPLKYEQGRLALLQGNKASARALLDASATLVERDKPATVIIPLERIRAEFAKARAV
ncbi:winged helix-turn-helix domain-containing protein [Chitinimonas sp.]|uniref:protein kinase domain-containing protein n=1 Tax=Chitinimonas sp. TaxID=1934313 RepID=UPI0035B0D5EB